MQRLLLNIFLFIVTGHVCKFKAQYTGGISDGHASRIFTLSACPPPANTNIYRGGNGDGQAANSIVATVCPPPANTNIYRGGNSDGYALAAFMATVCPPPANTNIYYGGNADGHARAVIITTVCPPQPNTNIYYGGIADAFAGAVIITTVCPPQPNTNIYTGGSSDGFAVRAFTVCTVALPIELISFTGACYDQQIILKWVSATETNNKYYTLERGVDGMSWQTIGKVDGAGTSMTKHDYSFIDTKPNKEISYYRLRQTDRDGKWSYADPITIFCNEGAGSIVVYPNPGNGHFFIEGAEKNSDLIITNPLGTLILRNKTTSGKIELDLSGQANGVYFLEIISVYKTSVQKIIKNK